MPQYFDAAPAAPSRPSSVELVLADVRLTLAVDRGVFAGERIDHGTRVLLEQAPPPPEGNLLDLGCGYGPIALTMATRSPASTVWAVDVNERALRLCAANAKAAKLGNVRTVAPDDVPDGLTFAALWSNPPIRVGKVALHELLDRWMPRLKPGATAHLVVQKHLGADSLAEWLTASGWPTTRLRSKQGFRVLEARVPV